MIIEKKRLRAYGLTQVEEYFRRAKPGFYEITIKQKRDRRSNAQNRWLWGKIYPMLLQGFLDAGWDEFTCEEEVHEWCKQHFSGKRVVNRITGEVDNLPNSTKKMDTIEFCSYCEQLRTMAVEYLGITIPEPNKELIEEND